jgi:RHS repeat-associated protein
VTSSYSDPNNPATVFSAAHYNAFGGLTSDTLGDNEIETYTYAPKLTRLQSYTASLNSTSIYSFNITSFAPDADILAANDSVNGNWTYSYDAFNRLVGANKNSGQAVYSYVYDRFGNRWQQNGPNTFLAIFTGNNPGTPQNNNRMDGYSYDRMVEQNRSGTYTEIVYSPGGAKLALMSGSGGQTLQKAFVPLPGQASAVYTSSGLDHYRHSDWLGSARLTSSPSRTVLSTAAYAPFGEIYSQTGPADLSFTGQNQDTVSGDYDFLYREYSNRGRWPSPDPAGATAVILDNPQSWNRYAYVLNNPLRFTDPLGLWCVWQDGTHDDAENNGGVGPTACLNDGGLWDDTNSLTGCDSNWSCTDGNGISVQGCSDSEESCVWQPADSITVNGDNSSGFTLGIRAPGQTYRQCLSANSSNYSLNTFTGTDNFLLSNDATGLLFGDGAEGSAGLLVWEGGSHSFEAGVGTVVTAGRRTASITSMNIAGKTGPAARILAKTGAEKLAGCLTGAAELKLAADLGLAGAEAIGCLVPR